MGKISQFAEQTLTITLASLASGSGRQAALVTTSGSQTTAFVTVKATTGTSPTNEGTIDVYLLRRAGSVSDENFGNGDAAIAVSSATLIGSITVSASSDTTYRAVFDTAAAGPLTAEWTVAIVNRTGAALNATAGNHAVTVVPYTASPTPW